MVLQKIKELLETRRDLEKSKLVETAESEDGYFDVNDYSGGNADDAFELGMEIGEADLIEELLALISEK